MIGAIKSLATGSGRSIENPNVPLSEIDWDHPYGSMMMGGTQSSSGETVNTQTALTVSAAWKGCSLIAGIVGKTPIHRYRRIDGGKERDATPAEKLLTRKPNEFMNALDFKQTITAHALLTGRGNGYAYIERTRGGEPTALLPLDPLGTFPLRVNGELWYATQYWWQDELQERKLPASDVLHIKGFGGDGLIGYDVIQFAKETLGGAIVTRKHGNVYFKNHARPGVVIEAPQGVNISPDFAKKLATQWKTMHQGVDNAHKTAILEQGLTAKVLADNARQSILVEAQQLDFVHVANVLGLPVHKCGGEGRTAYASLEQEEQSLLGDCYDLWFCRWEAELNDKLLTEREKDADSHFWEFTRDALVRTDTETLVNSLAVEVNNGLLSVDEARAIRNRPPLPDGLGEKFRMPLNHEIMGEEDDDDTPPEPAPIPPQLPQPDPENEEEEDEGGDEGERALAAHRVLLVDVMRRVHKRIAVHARKAARSPDSFVDWIDGLERDHGAAFDSMLGPVLGAVCELGGRDGRRQPNLLLLRERYFGGVRAGMLAAAECRPDELAARVGEWCDSEAESGPETFADSVIGRRVSHQLRRHDDA